MDGNRAELIWQASLLPGESPDAAFVHEAQSGDTTAFEALVHRHEAMVLRTAFRLLGQREDAQDAAQDVFLRLYRFLGKVDGTRPLEPWLYRLTVNACRDAARKRARHAARPLEDAAHCAEGPTADMGMREKERATVLHVALHCLTDRERTAIVLRDLEELPVRDVAKAMGCFEVTVRTYLRRGRLKLKRYYETHEDQFHGL